MFVDHFVAGDFHGKFHLERVYSTTIHGRI